MHQQTFTDLEYRNRKRKTRREEFLDSMEEIIPWDKWIEMIRPYYYNNRRGRPSRGIETMLRMYLLQIWFNLSDEGTKILFMTVTRSENSATLTSFPSRFPMQLLC